ncbi:MAG: ABC transporter permease [Hyphomicrobiaceae bacterium]|nr:ABC transporter permease [Hyphomicrobiaceae bacterium]
MLSSLLIQTLNGLASASLLFLVALGLTLIFGVTRVVNFAHGSFFMLGAYVGVTLFDRLGGGALGFWGGALGAGLAVATVGLAVEVLVLRRIYRAPELLQLVATFGIVLIVKDAALYVWGPEDLLGPRPPGLGGSLPIFGKPLPVYDLFLILLGPAMLAGVWALLTRTTWGLRVRAATEDRDMAAALGIDQAMLFSGVFVLGAFLAGLAGALALPREPASLGLDLSVIADVFVVTVVGGLGSIPGAYLAAVLISVAKAWCIGIGTLTLGGITVSFTKLTIVAEFLVMAGVLMARPWGLLGAEPVEGRVAHGRAWPLDEPRRRFWLTVATMSVVLPAMTLLADRYTLVLLTDVAVFAVVASSLGILMGWGGMASFGHAAYFGAGAYGAALAALGGAPFVLALGAGIALSGVLAAVFGRLALRADGISLAMLTLAFAQITWAVAFQWDAVTGGSNGLVGIWPPALLADRRAYYLFAVVVAGLTIAGVWRLAHAPFGYALRATRDHRRRAQASGLDIERIRWAAFVLSGSLAGLAGSVYVFAKGSLSPDALAIPRSVDALVMVLLGGAETLVGPALGAMVFTLLSDWITRATPYWQALLGLAIVALTLVFPHGISGTLARWRGAGATP